MEAPATRSLLAFAARKTLPLAVLAGVAALGTAVALSVGQRSEGGAVAASPPATPQAALSFHGPETVFVLPWDDSATGLGRRRDPESAPEGPMSFAVGPGGDVFVLDQVHLRVLRVSPGGAPRGAIPIPADTFQDVAVAADGSIVLLDRLARRSLLVLDAAGRTSREVPVEGEGVPEGGLVTSMAVREDGVWLEVGHERAVRVLDGSLRPCARKERPGRLLPDGGSVVASLDGRGGARIELLDASGGIRRGTTIALGSDATRIVEVGGDGAGRLYVVAHLLDFDDATGLEPVYEDVVGVVLDGELRDLASLHSPWVITGLEQFREFVLLPGGDLWQMAFGDDGARFLRWIWQ